MTTDSLVANATSMMPNGKHNFVAREANRLAAPFVSIEKRQPLETSVMVGNTRQPLFVPIFVGVSGQSCVGEDFFNPNNDQAKCECLDNFLNDFLGVAAMVQRYQNGFLPN